MSEGITAGFLLDRQWHWLRGEMETTKKPALLAVVRILAAATVRYAIIDGIAVQVHHPEPRTTLDIDIALLRRDDIPSAALTEAGFERSGVVEHSENWIAQDGTPVQFSDDPVLAPAVNRADETIVDEIPIRVIRAVDLLHEKIRAGSDPARRRSKRLQDLADAAALVEVNPALARELRVDERRILDQLPK